MSPDSHIFRLRDHAIAILAALACAHAIGLVELSRSIPHGALLAAGTAEQGIGLALCTLAHALVLTWLYRRRMKPGPLYRCGATRPYRDYAKPYQRGTSQLLEGWHYR
ncbi:hypothetical protein [Blastomonas sp. AAP53]|uniref:hypothetical protein n=1 Tax=Blastomonas sp. AAP53 TaxID=1248760 RepID=UPI0002ED586B|nr:hypothetical protein [Blastomonas sp. AAP53]